MRGAQQIPEHGYMEPQRRARSGDVVDRPLDLVGQTWLTTHEAADYLRFTGKRRLRQVYRFIKDKGVVTGRRGLRTLLVKRQSIDRALEGK